MHTVGSAVLTQNTGLPYFPTLPFPSTIVPLPARTLTLGTGQGRWPGQARSPYPLRSGAGGVAPARSVSGLLAPGRSGRRRAVEALPSRSARLSGLRLGRLGEAGRYALLCRASGRYPKRGVCMISIPPRPGSVLLAYASATLFPLSPGNSLIIYPCLVLSFDLHLIGSKV